MDSNTANILRRLTGEFYANHADSFSATRQHAWPGWERVASCIVERCGPSPRILDVACGNMRFEKFFNESVRDRSASFLAIDSCRALSVDVENVTFEQRDVLECLDNGTPLTGEVSEAVFDAAVCFGFMHHVPGLESRLVLVDSLLDHVRSGGVVAIAFWRFMSDARLARKAGECTLEAQERWPLHLEPDDYLLGWKDDADAFRYCHHFGPDEISEIVRHASSRAREVERFYADGRTGDLNQYIVLERR